MSVIDFLHLFSLRNFFPCTSLEIILEYSAESDFPWIKKCDKTQRHYYKKISRTSSNEFVTFKLFVVFAILTQLFLIYLIGPFPSSRLKEMVDNSQIPTFQRSAIMDKIFVEAAEDSVRSLHIFFCKIQTSNFYQALN
jgi:hypothetical protein